MEIRAYICPLRNVYIMDGPGGSVIIPLTELRDTYFMTNPTPSEIVETYNKLLEKNNINKEDL